MILISRRNVSSRKCRTSSEVAARHPSASNSHGVDGTWPFSSAAMVSAVNATNSPCGTRITRVTANTSTVAIATSA